jgi:Tfp pilus assembly protein PilE
MNRPNVPSRRTQAGATLIVAMVMLLAMSLLAIWGYNSSTANMRIVGNTQARQETQAAAETAIEKVLSTSAFKDDPAATAQSTVDVKVNGTTYTAHFATPGCYKAKVIKQTELDVDKASDVQCIKSPQQGGPMSDDDVGAAGNSLCSSSEWHVAATVADPTTGASETVHQGVAVRVLTDVVTASCPS